MRNTARYNAAVLPAPVEAKHDWEIFVGLADAHARVTGEPTATIAAPAQMLDSLLNDGPYGANSGREVPLTLAELEAAPHGVDLGPLRPSLLERLCTPDRKINCLPPAIRDDIARLRETLSGAPPTDELLLIGRRHLRSNNSWLHNSHRLVKGPRRDQLLMHPTDLAARSLSDEQEVTVRSRVGAVTITVHATDELMPGTVSLPHGFGHARDGIKLQIAAEHAGVSANDLTDERWLDELSGNAALNGVPVTVSA